MSALIITGTGTGVGKTVVTAALAALAADREVPVAVVKPAQTGVGFGEPGDLAEIERLSGVTDTHEFARFLRPLSPDAAARQAGKSPLDLDKVAEEIRDLRGTRGLVLVEGAGGLLVRYDPEGRTIADLARMLEAPVLVVADPGLGTLNHTALTLEAMAHRGLQLAGIVLGSWPAEPGLAHRTNIADLETLAGRPLAGAVAEKAGALGRINFLAAARAGLSAQFGGTFDSAGFKTKHLATLAR